MLIWLHKLDACGRGGGWMHAHMVAQVGCMWEGGGGGVDACSYGCTSWMHVGGGGGGGCMLIWLHKLMHVGGGGGGVDACPYGCSANHGVGSLR